MAKRETWSSRTTFILAAIGSAVGLGNAWRFPGLVAKYGGGAFLFVYLFAMLIIGVPLLMMEISIGRRTKQGAPGAFRTINKKAEPIGWAATTNAFVIVTYYAIVFAWVILMAVCSFKFAGLTGKSKAASNLFFKLTETTGTIKGIGIPPIVLICAIVAWILIYACIRKGTVSAGKVVKYTGVTLPLIFLVIMAIKGVTMDGAMIGMEKLFIPNFESLKNPSLWIDAVGQVFYSLSIMMAIMFAYGSYLEDSSNIATDVMIIAFSDLGVSVLSGVVMFSTMYGTGMTVDNMSASGIATAFIIYPQAIVNLTNNGVVNAIFGLVFYLCLCSLAIDSAFSIAEGVSTAIADKFKVSSRKVTKGVIIVAALISLVYCTKSGLAWLDIVDNWTNQYNMIIIGVLECIAVGWFFNPNKVLEEANKNSKNFKMPSWWFNTSIKFIAPIILTGFFIWNIYGLFSGGGVYGKASGYPLWSNVVAGWLVMALVFASGFIIKALTKNTKFDKVNDKWDDDEEKEVVNN